MEIRRSEVYFGLRGYEFSSVQRAQNKGFKYYALCQGDNNNVYHADLNRNRVCKVSDLTDDRPSPFPPLEAEQTSDTPTDQARDAALRESNIDLDYDIMNPQGY